MSIASALSSVKFRRRLRQFHRGIGVIVAVQLLFWVGGGLVMTSFDLDLVHGDPLRSKQPPANLSAKEPLMPINQVLLGHAQPVTEVRLYQLAQTPVYWLKGPEGEVLFDARSGEKISPLDEAFAKRLGLADYAGDAELKQMNWVTEAASEYRGRGLPLWQLQFADELNTAVYISPQSGRVVARRNDVWRLFDFVWMLHIMDYQQKDDFNHPLLVTFAATAFVFVISGFFMLWLSFRRK